MEPAATIIRALGGSAALASLLGLHRVTVSKWPWPRERGGLDGRVPQAHHRAILDAAQAQAIDLSAEDLLPVRAAAQPAEALA